MTPLARQGRRMLPLAAMIALLAAALALRLFRADAQSLWYDEGTSAALATRTLGQIVANASDDIHPPLYYLLLALWARLFGDGVVALRALSALLGTLAVSLSALAARRMWGTTEAVVAALLAAVSPMLVWYSQEVRMYVLSATLGAALVALAVSRAQADRARPWLRRAVVVAVAAGALYTHYFAGATALLCATAVAALVAARGATAGGRTAGASRRALADWLAAMAVAALLFMPWLARAWHTVRDWPALGPRLTSGAMASGALGTFALGVDPPAQSSAWLLAFVLAAAAGLAAGIRRRRRLAMTATIAWAGVPVLAMWALSLLRPAWNPKFLIVGAPGFDVLLAAGVVASGRAAGAAVARVPAVLDGSAPARSRRPRAARAAAAGVACALLIALLWPRAAALRAMYFDPAHQRDDYRSIARTIDALAGPHDVVIVNAPTQVEVLGYYDRGRHDIVPLPIGRPPDRAATLRALEDLGATRRDVFAVLWATTESDPDGLVESWLADSRAKAFDRWFGDVRLARWSAPRAPVVARGDLVPIAFGDDEIVLVNLSVGAPTTTPGDVVTVEAWWVAGERSTPPRADYVEFLHLVDAADRIVAQRDLAPDNGRARTTAWAPIGERGLAVEVDRDGRVQVEADAPICRDRAAVSLPPDLAPGTYRLLLGLYDPATGARLPVRPFVTDPRRAPLPRPDALEIASVRVVPRSAP